MPFAVAFSGSAERDALVDGHIAAHDRGFANHHACCMVDKKPPPQQRAGMDINAGIEARDLREDARRQA